MAEADVLEKLDEALAALSDVNGLVSLIKTQQETLQLDLNGVSLIVGRLLVDGTVSQSGTQTMGGFLQQGIIEIYAGDDYSVASGRGLFVYVEEPNHSYALSDGTATAVLRCVQGEFPVTPPIEEVPTGYLLTFNLDHDQTALLTERQQDYKVIATLTNGDIVTLVEGVVITRANIEVST